MNNSTANEHEIVEATLDKFVYWVPNNVNNANASVTIYEYDPVNGVSTKEHPIIAWMVKKNVIVDVLTLPALEDKAVYSFSVNQQYECRTSTTFVGGYVAKTIEDAKAYAAGIFLRTIPHPKTGNFL